MGQLRGTLALVNFWTYSCINSRRPMIYLKRWHTEYGPLGLRVIGIHTPEFRFEHDRSNVEAYIRQEAILYPVGLDNGYRTWDAFQNDAWPAFYLVDRSGRVMLAREGEGYGHEMERVIRSALDLADDGSKGHPGDDPDLSGIQTPETYFGAQHPTPQDIRQSPRLGTSEYSFAQATGPALNQYLLDGTWSREDERLVLVSARGGLRFRFSAARLYMVAGAPNTAAMHVRVDGEQKPPVEIGWPTLYTVVDGNTYGEHLLEVVADTPGLTLFSATFG
jgi:thiol-disulfide isomerase/thioredoxin